MITKYKLEIYKRYDGDIDGWSRIGKKKEKEIMTDDDWFEIRELRQKVFMLKGGLVSEDFAQIIREAIKRQTDDEVTANILIESA